MTRNVWWCWGGSPVARQVVHAGVHTVFMSSQFPTRHGGDGMEVGGGGRVTGLCTHDKAGWSYCSKRECLLVGVFGLNQ